MTPASPAGRNLEAIEQARTLVGPSLEAATVSAAERPELELSSGETVGRYIVLARIGAGGMGVVYAAYDPELDRKVALKLLRADAGEVDARARLLREAQAMARLQHPNVVAVFDVGAIAGHVWVAMEFVDGQVLSVWSAGAGRSWRDVLEVMCAAGRGLAAAHAAGLVHRDVKPDNVMVGADGRVRLMDFGLVHRDVKPGDVRLGADVRLVPGDAELSARRSMASHSTDLELTAAGTILGTPAYMAAEQFTGLPTDARTDQFGWCATCWEALFGQRPYTGVSLAELTLAVTGGQLRSPPPSSVPRWLRRALERGLRPDPRDRYPSMDALLAELVRGQGRTRRWLSGLGLATVLAAAAGLYGADRLARVEAVSACEQVGAALTPVWSDDVRTAMSAAFGRSNPRLGAIASAKTAAWLDNYVAVWKDSRVTVCREATIDHTRSLEVAAGVVACLEDQQIDLEAIVGVLVEADAEVVQRAAHLVSGLPPASACLLEPRAPRPAGLVDPIDRGPAVALRRRLVRAVALEDTGKFDAGLAAARDVLHEAERLGLTTLRAEAQMRIGNLHERRGAFAEAERALEDAMVIAAAAGHDEIVAEAGSMLTFTVSFRQGRHDEALRWARLSEAALQRIGAENSLRAARLHSVLGTVHRLRGDLELALSHSERALALRETLLGPKHPDVARSLNTLGNVALARRDFDLAVRCHERALAIRGEAYGVDSHDVATSMKNLGDAHLARGAPDDAFMFHNDALALREHLLGPQHPDVAVALIDLGRTHLARRDPAAARTVFVRAAELRERIDAGPSTRAEAWTLAGEAALALGDPAQAVADLERALALHGDSGPPSAGRATTLAALAQALVAVGDPTRASATARLADEEAAKAARIK